MTTERDSDVATRGAALFRLKPVTAQDAGELRRTLGLGALTSIGIGATLGTGIFVILGQAVPAAGPAVVLSFVLAGVTALLSALSYAELAGMIPVAGSAYSYAYATLGELVAWVCGWCLHLEYGISIGAIAVGWGQYLNELLALAAGWRLPDALSQPPDAGGIVNLPSVVVVLLAMLFLLRGARETAWATSVMVAVKVVTLVFFCAVAFTALRAENLEPFAPLGIAGVSAASATLFFSYIGFDAASTAGQEAKHPQRDMPRAIMLALVIVTVLYCLVALAAVGAMPWTRFAGTDAALSQIVSSRLQQPVWGALIAVGAVVATASVVLTVLYGQTRILYSMSRDGLVPPVFARVHPRTGVPRANTLIVSVFVAVLAAVVPLGKLADATSIGALFAFGLVNIAVVVLRRTRPDHPRGFRVPWSPVLPVLGLGCCVYLMFSLDVGTWVIFGLWMLLGLVVYFGYGLRHSHLRETR